MKILILIPAFNEEANIVRVIQELHVEDPTWALLVINDGSRDNTEALAEATSKAAVITLPCNLGIGGAVQTGFKYARDHGYDIAVQFDGDGQHQASEIRKLLAPLLRGEADVIIGSRFCEQHDGWKSSASRRLGIRLFEILNRLLIKQRITDSTSGFRAYNQRSLRFLATYYPLDYPEPEAVILLKKNGFTLMETLVSMQARQGGRSSIYGVKPLYYMCKVMLAVCISALRPKLPLIQERAL